MKDDELKEITFYDILTYHLFRQTWFKTMKLALQKNSNWIIPR